MDGLNNGRHFADALGKLGNRVALLEAENVALKARVALLEAEDFRLSEGVGDAMQLAYGTFDLLEEGVLPIRRGESVRLAVEV